MELDLDALTAELNDDVDHWCPARTGFPGAFPDLGSPGSANDGCLLPDTDTDTP